MEDETLNESVYICGQCCQAFKIEGQCMSHVESHISRCYKCDFESDDKSQMVRHEKEHIQPCDHNGECSKIQHTERNEPQADNKLIFRCNECSLDFESGVEMERHTETEHSEAEPNTEDITI